MDCIERHPVNCHNPLHLVVGESYLKGFADAYSARWPVIPSGVFGEHYRKGYILGVAAVRREFYALAVSRIRSHPVDAACV